MLAEIITLYQTSSIRLSSRNGGERVSKFLGPILRVQGTWNSHCIHPDFMTQIDLGTRKLLTLEQNSKSDNSIMMKTWARSLKINGFEPLKM